MRQLDADVLRANFRTLQDYVSAQTLISPFQTAKTTLFALTDNTKFKKTIFATEITDIQPVSKHKNNNT
jgi:hypothetical protein